MECFIADLIPYVANCQNVYNISQQSIRKKRGICPVKMMKERGNEFNLEAEPLLLNVFEHSPGLFRW